MHEVKRNHWSELLENRKTICTRQSSSGIFLLRKKCGHIWSPLFGQKNERICRRYFSLASLQHNRFCCLAELNEAWQCTYILQQATHFLSLLHYILEKCCFKQSSHWIETCVYVAASEIDGSIFTTISRCHGESAIMLPSLLFQFFPSFPKKVH